MNLGAIEDHVAPALKKALSGSVGLALGPPVRSTITGLKPEVFLHAAGFEDLGGVTADGANVARRRASVPPFFKGFAEERPARITVEVSCHSPTYDFLKKLSALIPPPDLLALETMPAKPLCVFANNSVSLRFADFTAAIRETHTTRIETETAAYYTCQVVFRLEGFLHVVVSAKGGLKPQPKPRPPRPVPARPSRRPATRKRSSRG